MNCRIFFGITNRSYLLHSHRHDLAVQTYYCHICDAFFSDGGTANYDDIELTSYYLQCDQVIRSHYQKVFSFTESLVASGKFIYIGSGMGFSLDIAKQRGWITTGLKPNTALTNYTKERGLDINNTYLSGKTTGEYDFILIDNVLEHVLIPSGFLGHAARLLAHSRVMLVAVPPMNWLRKGFGAFSYVRDSITVPQMNIFGEVDHHSRKAVGHLLQSVGLRLLDVRFHHSFAYNNTLFRSLELDNGYYFVVRA